MTRTHGFGGPLDRRTVKTVTKVVLGAAALLFLLSLLRHVPGAELVLPVAPVTVAAIAGAVITVAVVALLVYVAPLVARLVEVGLSGPAAVTSALASIAFWLVLLAAVIVAHGGLSGLVTPMGDDLRWLYDVAFLLVALPMVAMVAYRLYAVIDPTADAVARRVA